MKRPNPFVTLIFALASTVFWFCAANQWFHHNDHWALFWLALSASFAQTVGYRVLMYRGVIR